MKKLSACLLAAALLFPACAHEEEPPILTPQPGIRPHVTEPYVAPAIPAEWGDEAERLLSVPWSVITPGATGDLTFDGEKIHWEVASQEASSSAEGVPSFADGVMTVDGIEFQWETLAAYCLLTVEGETWRLVRAASVEDAQRAYRLVSGTWTGDGMTLSFDGGSASFTAGDRSLKGAWNLTADGTLMIQSGAAGLSLSKGAKVTTTSMETPDFPPEKNADHRMMTASPGSMFGRYAAVRNSPFPRTVSPMSMARMIGSRKPITRDQKV